MRVWIMNVCLRRFGKYYKRGNTAEVKQRKDGIIVLEVNRKITYQDNG